MFHMARKTEVVSSKYFILHLNDTRAEVLFVNHEQDGFKDGVVRHDVLLLINQAVTKSKEHSQSVLKASY